MEDNKKTMIMVPMRARTPAGRLVAAANNTGKLMPRCPDELAPFFDFLKFLSTDDPKSVHPKDRIQHEKAALYNYGMMFPQALAQVWMSSARIALLSASMSKFFKPENIDSTYAFASGLFQDIGRLAIFLALSEDAPEKVMEIQSAMEQGTPLHDAEFTALGTDHCEVGAKVLEDWRAPEWLYQCVRNHNQPDFSSDPYLNITHATGRIVNHMAEDDPISFIEPIALQQLGIDEAFMRQYMGALLEFESLYSFLSEINPGQVVVPQTATT